MRNKTKWTAALLALAACGAAFAGEGNSATDRGKRAQAEQAKYLPLICRTGENAVAVPQADGSLQWTCSSASAAAPTLAD